MTVEEFTRTATALLRSAVGWQTAIAQKLEIEPRTVRRWLAAGVIPDWVSEKLATLIGLADITAWPRDEWVIGDTKTHNGARREYIVHLQPPRFVARIVIIGEDGVVEATEQPADVVSGVVYAIGVDTVLCEIDWIDRHAPGDIVKWLEAAGEAIQEDCP